MRILLQHRVDPADIPVAQAVQDLQCLLIASVRIGVSESHNCFVHDILRGPDMLVILQLVKIFLRYRTDPISAVQLLTFGQF
ncbi:hypothetical protein D3C73_1462940 [compost metagenome]